MRAGVWGDPLDQGIGMLRFFAALLAAGLLAGCNTVVPYKDVYDGLLPAGHRLQDAPVPLSTGNLKSKTVVLVTTTNFDTYTSTWQEHWEKGGIQRYEQKTQGAVAALSLFAPASSMASGFAQNISGATSSGGSAQIGRASDPRLVVARVYAMFQPVFREVKAASDFASALEMKADYIALVDYYGTFNEMGDRYRTRGGIYFLDGSLRHVFDAQGFADVERDDGGFFGGAEGVYRGTAATMTKALEGTLGQILSQTRARLGAK